MARPISLKLYVTGVNTWAEENLHRLTQCLEAEEHTTIQFEVIDVLTAPHRAESARVIATPTLVKESPLPARKVIGDLSDVERVISFLGLRNAGDDASSGDCV